MKKVLLSTTVAGAFVVYVIYEQLVSPHSANNLENINTGSNSLTLSTPNPTTIQNNMMNINMNAMHMGYKDGEYTGSSVDVFYGNVQVAAVIQGGKITDIKFLDYPQDRRTSQYISSQALPILKSEAIQNQSASINAVSGATQTSRGFIKSLGSALSQAKI